MKHYAGKDIVWHECQHPDHISIPITKEDAADLGVTGEVTCSDMEYLAAQVEQMRYDCVEEFIGALAKRFLRRSIADANREKIRLAQELNEVSEHLSFADAALMKAWAICKTHMKEEKDD